MMQLEQAYEHEGYQQQQQQDHEGEEEEVRLSLVPFGVYLSAVLVLLMSVYIFQLKRAYGKHCK